MDIANKISNLNNWAWQQAERALLPLGNGAGLAQKVAQYAVQAICAPAAFALCLATSAAHLIASRFSKSIPDHPLIAFAKRPSWETPGPDSRAPVPIGFATAGFQDNGPKTHPYSNWGAHHKDTPIPHVPDFWNHPERFIKRLQNIGARHFRFSIDRDLIQPIKDGPIHELNLWRYAEIIRQLKAVGIEPMITLVHFCDPLYFSWEREEDIAELVDYAARVCDMLAEEGVSKVIPINEPTVPATQGYSSPFGNFPPYQKNDFQRASLVLKNMMAAHNLIYDRVKKHHPEMQIGFCNNSVGFSNYHKWNPLFAPIEKLLCAHFNKLDQAFRRHLHTGLFELKVPFLANISFPMEKPKMDFFAAQYYCNRVLISANPFYPGSVSRVPGEKVCSYQFRAYPQGLASALYEASLLKTPEGDPVPIEITEIGMDTGINSDESDAPRIEYFGRIFQVVEKALQHGIHVRGLYFWTLIRNIEWYQMDKVDFGFYDFDFQTGAITKRPVVDWVQGQIQRSESASEASGY